MEVERPPQLPRTKKIMKMRIKTRVYYYALLVFLCVSASATASNTNNNWYLFLWADDSTSVSFLITDIYSLSFSETEVIVSTDIATLSYPISNLLKLSYGLIESTNQGLEDIPIDAVNVIFTNECVRISNIKKNSQIYLFSISGTLIYSQEMPREGSFDISLSNLCAGVYLIRINEKTYKFLKI